MSSNPFTGRGVYYPPCVGAMYAYHGVYGGHGPDGIIKTEATFREIWKQGAILSSQMRTAVFSGQARSMLHGMDVAAGDDQYVFCSVCVPHGGAAANGYTFAFDGRDLVANGALVGLDDLQGFYMRIAELLKLTDRNDYLTYTDAEKEAFLELTAFVQSYWRLRGAEAMHWVDWIMGRRPSTPVNQAVLRWTNRELRAHMENIIRWVTTSPREAVGYAELLVPELLPLEHCVGVNFRKDWIEIADFVDFYGLPGNPEPPPVVNLDYARWVEDRRGHPARCPRCRRWVGLPPGALPESPYQSWAAPSVHRSRMRVPGYKYPEAVWVCQSCGAAFLRTLYVQEDRFRPDQYVGQYEGLEHAYT